MNKLFQAQTQAEALLLKASLNPSLEADLTTAFGNNYNVTVANNLFTSWQNQDFSNLPKIEILSPTEINGAQGAYSATNNTIYLSSSLVREKSLTAIRDVIIEEYGHFIDAQINDIDSQGDEGEIWRNLVLNRKMSATQLETLRNENDLGTITLAGETLNVENSIITLNVNTVFDENDGSATTGSGLSLRDAIIIANNDTANEYIINLASGQTYFLTLGSSGENNALGGDLDIKDETKISVRTNGNSPATINGTTIVGGDSIFNVLGGGTLTLEKLVVTGGQNTYGGGIYNDGTLNIAHSTIRSNSATNGGGIYNSGGTLNIVHSTISNNSADSGGGICNNSGSLNITHSTINGNSAGFDGGGIVSFEILNIIHSTISDNSAGFDGGGIYNGSGVVALAINTTITNNTADADNNNFGDGGGIYNKGTFATRNSIVAGNFDTPNNAGSGTKHPDISGSIQGNAYNLIGNLTGASGTIGTGSDIVLASGQTAGLGALANNGGFTKTHALLTGSPAINAGLTVLIGTDLGDIDGDGNISEVVPRDQRGGNFVRVSGASVDIGAFEFQTALPTLRINDITITEGNSGTKNAVFTVTRTGTPTGTITLNYATANGTATAGSDYVAKTGTLSFATNETSKTISVVINGDTTVEANETFFVNLSGSTNATIADNQGQGTITNDDFPSLAINNVTVTEGNSGTKNAVFTVTRTGTALQPITVNYATANGTTNPATAGSDYVAKSGTLSFATNETSKTISVVINGDTTVEANETFFVNLSGATNATIADNQGLGTITNDDTIANLLLVGNANNNNLVGGTGNDTLQGLAGNDTLRGFAGNDRIEGGTGADSMVGSTGNDTYFVDNTLDRVIENANEGTDTVQSTITYTLLSNQENLIFTGTDNLNGIGNILNNVITGNSGNNNLNGGGGNDTLTGGAGNDTLNGNTGNDSMVGGSGNDTYYVDSTGDRVMEALNEGTDTVRSTITYTLLSNQENLIFTGANNLNGIGNILNNVITGNSGNNNLNGGGGNDTLTGGAGNDILNGNTGADSMVGGSGNDTYYVDSTGDRVIENVNEGTDTVRSTITYTLLSNQENLIFTGANNLNGTGNILNNVITGNSGNNNLNGGGGNDTLTGGAGNDILNGNTGNDSMVGGTGNDTYFVDNTLDRVIENANEGTDTVNSSISYLLGNNLENLTLTGTTNLVGLGNALNNSITGNSGANILNGNDGNDTLLGGAGNDNLNGGNGNDRIDGGTGNDMLLGSAGNDTLIGGDGNDTLIGGNGADSLSGGIRSDRFVFKYADERIDRITDFSVAQGDKIVVSASGFSGGLTANTNLTTAQFRLGSSATNTSQRLIYNSANGALFFDQDGNGIIPSVQIATLNTGLTLTSADIFVES